MEEESMNTLQSIFEAIEGPRVDRTKQHQLLDIIIIAIVRSALWSGGMGGNRVFWQNQRGLVVNLFRSAQWHPLS